MLLTLFLPHARAADGPRVRLPDTEGFTAWEAAASLVGVNLVTTSDADVVVVPGPEGWTLRVVDEDGELHTVNVPVPQAPLHREEMLWLARSLVEPVRAPEVVPVETEPEDVEPELPVAASPVLPPPTLPRKGPWAVGLVAGAPLGVDVTLDLEPQGRHLVEVRLGTPARRWFWLQANYIATLPVALGSAVSLRGYTGLGAVAEGAFPDGLHRRWKGPWFGPRVPVGLELAVGRVEIFADVAPTWFIGKRQGLRFPAAAGLRFTGLRTRHPTAQFP